MLAADNVLDCLFPTVGSSSHGKELLDALSGAGALAQAWEQRCSSVRRQLAAAEAALPLLLGRDCAIAAALARDAGATEADVRATIAATEGEEQATRRLAEAIATLTNNVRSVTAVRDYTATLATVMQESEDLRVALSSRRPRAGSDTSDDDGDGEATTRGDAGTAASASASASVALADRVRALGHACCALEAGEGRRVVLQRCRSLIAAVKPVVVGELEGAVEGVGWASLHAGSPQPSPPALSTFLHLLQCVTDLQFCEEAIVAPGIGASASGGDRAGTHGSAEHGSAAAASPPAVPHAGPTTLPAAVTLGRLWAVERLAFPLIVRFRFHFRMDRPTNAVDRPEWFFHHVLTLCRDRVGVVEEAQRAVAGMKVGHVDLLHQFIDCLVEEVMEKVRELGHNVKGNHHLLVHLVDEAVAFEKALAAEFQYRQLTSGKGTGADPLSCVGVFEANPELLAAWVQADNASVLELLEGVLHDSTCWTSRFDVLRSMLQYHPSSAASKEDAVGSEDRRSLHQATESADVVTGLVRVVLDRCRAVRNDSSKLMFVDQVLRPLLARYIQELGRQADNCDLSLGLGEASDHGNKSWALLLAVLNSALVLHDALLEHSLDPEVAAMEAAAVAVQATSKASRVDVADLGRKALEGVSQVATGLTTARVRVKEKLVSSGALRGFEMVGLGVVARTLLTGNPEGEEKGPAVGAGAGVASGAGDRVVEEGKGEEGVPRVGEASTGHQEPQVVLSASGLFGPEVSALSALSSHAIARVADELAALFVSSNRPYKAKRSTAAFGAHADPVTRLGVSSTLDVTPELYDTLSVLQFALNFMCSRVATHVSVRLLASAAGTISGYLLDHVVRGGTLSVTAVSQLRVDVDAVVKVFTSFVGVRNWANVKFAFSELMEAVA